MARKRSRFCQSAKTRIFIQALEPRTYLSYGAVDHSASNFKPIGPMFYRAAVQADGKIVETMGDNLNFTSDFQIGRLNPDGSVDTSFGSNGTVTTNFGYSDLAEGIAIQANGKIDVVGTSTVWNVQGRYAWATASWISIAQYNPDGSLDTTFSHGTGMVTLNAYTYGQALCVAIDGDKILVGGSISSGAFIARFNLDGTLDTTFNGTGVAVPLSSTGTINSLAVDAQGRILAGGENHIDRLNGDGTLDTSFGTGGIASIPASAGEFSELVVLPDSSILATSMVVSPVITDEIKVLRLTPDGQLDPTFGVSGIAVTNATDAESLTMLPDGKILVGASDAGGEASAVVRLNADGTLDDTFGYDGYFSAGSGPLGAVFLLPDGRYLLVGGTDYRIDPLLPSPAPTTMVGNAGGPYTVAEQQSINLSASETGDIAGSYEWDFNYDGVTFNPEGSGSSPSYSSGQLDGPSTHEIAVRIRNQWGSPVIATTTLNIVNGPPTATFSHVKSTVYVGSPDAVQFTNQSDSTVDMAQGFHYSYDFNNDGVFEVTDSSSPTQIIPPSYLNAAGTFTIHGRITDDEGASSDYTTTISVIVPPLATISGALFQDTNENGVQDINEPPLAGWKVYIDSNHNRIDDAGESSATTDSYGYYSIAVSPGTYDVGVSPQAGYQPVVPADGIQTTTFASGSSSTGVNFGFYQTTLGSIAGNVFNDRNGDGTLGNGEAGIAGAEVYLDANNNGTLDSNEVTTTTDAYGNYFFGNLNPGTYAVRAVTPSGWQQTSPANDAAQTVSVAPGQSVLGIQFAQAQLNSSITGTFFYDTNGNGLWDSGEGISPLWGVYLDLNNDGVRQSNEPELIANNSGVYTFTGLLPGLYHVRPTTAAKWTQTAPPGGAENFNTISGETVANANFGEVRGAATVTPSDPAEFVGNSLTLQLAYSGFHSVTSWTINWGDGSSVQTVTGSPTSVAHTYSTASGLSPYTISAWATSSDGSAPAKPLNVMIFPQPTISGGELTVNGTRGDDTVTFSNTSGVFTVDFDGAIQHYNSSLFSDAIYLEYGGNDSITNTTGENIWLGDIPSAAKMSINAISGTITVLNNAPILGQPIYFSSIHVASGAKFIMNGPVPKGNVVSQFWHYVAVIDAGGLNIASGGTFDLGDNDLILNYAAGGRAAADALVFNLLSSGITPAGDWSGTGITSSEANYDANFGIGARALGWIDNNDVQYSSFDSVPLADFNQVIVKFTYYGDVDLSGTFDATDVNQLIAGRSHTPGNTGWEFGDFDYDGVTSSSVDQNLFFAGRSAYQKYGVM